MENRIAQYEERVSEAEDRDDPRDHLLRHALETIRKCGKWLKELLDDVKKTNQWLTEIRENQKAAGNGIKTGLRK